MKRLLPYGLILLFFATILASLALGDAMLRPGEVLSALFRRGDEMAITILWDIRLPRTLVGVAAGAGLAASGVVMQAFFRNSLASPGLLGVSSGASLGAVIALAFAGASTTLWTVPLAALMGGFMATAAVMFMARRGASSEHLLLCGVALNALFGAGTSFILGVFANQVQVGAQIIYWLLGGIENRTWEHVWMSLPMVALSCVLLLPLGRSMNLLALGETGAQSLGVNVRRLKWELIALSTLLTALATAVSGIVGFVGLVTPHLLRLALGPDHRRLLPLAMLAGASMVLLCDLPTRFLSANLRLGVMTSLVGGPFLLFMLRKKPC